MVKRPSYPAATSMPSFGVGTTMCGKDEVCLQGITDFGLMGLWVGRKNNERMKTRFG
jgi:hypothetical protein